jgi:hypothetical protein
MIEGFSLINVRDLCANSCNGIHYSIDLSIEVEYPDHLKDRIYYERDFKMSMLANFISGSTDNF